MSPKIIYYCKKCLAPYVEGHCVVCGGVVERDLTDEEQMYQRAAMKVLRNHRAEYFAAMEEEKASRYEY